jgi:hypothetical protein
MRGMGRRALIISLIGLFCSTDALARGGRGGRGGGRYASSGHSYSGGRSGSGRGGWVGLTVLGLLGIAGYFVFRRRPRYQLPQRSAPRPILQGAWFDVTAVDDSGRYAIERRVVDAQDSERAAAAVLWAFRFTRRGGRWRITNVVPVRSAA